MFERNLPIIAVGSKVRKGEAERLYELTGYERQFSAQGRRWIAGMDEAGRGPLAGPVVVAGVIMPGDFYIEGIKDSKKISEPRREKLYERIVEHAIEHHVSVIDEKTIDDINILNATRLGFETALEKFTQKPDFVLADAIDRLQVEVEYLPLVKGDDKVYSIGAASILAKVTRDRLMRQLDQEYPQYGFAKHKGYGTQEHIQAILHYGPCPAHRASFLTKILAGTQWAAEKNEA